MRWCWLRFVGHRHVYMGKITLLTVGPRILRHPSRAAPSSLQKHFDSDRTWKLPLPPLPAPFSSPHELDVGDHPAKHAFASISLDNIAEMCSSLIRAVHSFVPLFCPKQTVIKKHGFSPGKPRKNPGVASSVATIVPKGLSYNHSEDANASYKALVFWKKRILRKERYKHYYLGSPQSSTIQKKWELYQFWVEILNIRNWDFYY